MEEHYGNDPSIVTIDELAGQWLALVALPEGVVPLLFSLVFFRFFDIAKPGPVDAAQRLPGGWGIMVDDLLAGLFANLSVRALLLLLLAFSFLALFVKLPDFFCHGGGIEADLPVEGIHVAMGSRMHREGRF